MTVSNNGQVHTLELRVPENTEVVIGMLMYKRRCDPEHRQLMADFMNKQNFELAMGGFEMDHTNRRCRFRNASTHRTSS
jgi:hypothetical protein